MFIAVLYKDERTAPRGQNAVRQCLRPGRGQADFLYSSTIKCAIERFIEPTCQIIGTALPVGVDSHRRAVYIIVLGINAQRCGRVGVVQTCDLA